jgi:hypothetical protein
MFSVCHVRAHVLLVQYQLSIKAHPRDAYNFFFFLLLRKVVLLRIKTNGTTVYVFLWTVRGARVHLYYPLCALTQTAFPPLSC